MVGFITAVVLAFLAGMVVYSNWSAGAGDERSNCVLVLTPEHVRWELERKEELLAQNREKNDQLIKANLDLRQQRDRLLAKIETQAALISDLRSELKPERKGFDIEGYLNERW
jgi:hypothetical protein